VVAFIKSPQGAATCLSSLVSLFPGSKEDRNEFADRSQREIQVLQVPLAGRRCRQLSGVDRLVYRSNKLGEDLTLTTPRRYAEIEARHI
jgi:hypothetical protein